MAESDDLIREFEFLAQLPEDERIERLRALESVDPERAVRLAALLDAHQKPHAVLDGDVLRHAAEQLAVMDGAQLVGKVLGEYRLDELIGRGGMSIVFRATRSHDGIDQPVAFKLMAMPMFDRRMFERFSKEAAILAQLEHRGIGRLHDWGVTEEGWPYLALDLVRGQPIHDYCREQNLSWRKRLAVLREVAQALAYAHRHLVVHLDLKPGNVLVTEEGWPVLLDFGVSQVLHQEGSQPATTASRWLTPDYASPEQLRGESISVASDIYALGVMLYELIAGDRPFRFGEMSIVGALDRIAQGPPTVTRAMKGLPDDLDAVIACAMHPDPERRYANADIFAADLAALIESRPVRARRDTIAYRFSKLLARHPVSMSAGAMAVSAISVMAVLLVMQTFDLRAQRDAAERERAHAAEVTEFLLGSIDAINPRTRAEAGIGLSGLLDVTEARVRDNGVMDVELRIALLEQIARTRMALSEYDEVIEAVDEALDLLSDDQQKLRARLLVLKSGALRSRGDGELALAAADDAIAAAAGDATLMIEARRRRAQALERLGRYEEADAYTQETMAMVPADDRIRLAHLHNDLAASALTRADFPQAAEQAGAALELYNAAYDEPHMETTEAAWRLAAALLNSGEPLRARELLEEALALRTELFGPEDHRVGEIHYVMSHTYFQTREPAAGLDHALKALEIYREALPADDRRVMAATGNVGSMYHHLGQQENALQYLTDAVGIGASIYGTRNHPDLGSFRNTIGEIFVAQGEFASAEEIFSELLDLYLEVTGEPSVPTMFLRHNLARCYRELGDPELGLEHARAAVAQSQQVFPPGHWIAATTHAEMAWNLLAAGDAEAASETAPIIEAALQAHAEQIPGGQREFLMTLLDALRIR